MKRIGTAAAIFCLASATVHATALTDDEIPGALREWKEWVLHDVSTYGCVEAAGEPVCIWPGRVTLDLTESGGTFEQEVYAEREHSSTLPGKGRLWPEAVSLNGKPIPVTPSQDGRPVVRIPAGTHRVTGRFSWEALPEGIDLPRTCGVVNLTINGKSTVAKRDMNGRLWLGSAAEGEGEDMMTLTVHRKLTDGIPMKLETRMSIRASGKAREVTVEGSLPRGTLPVSVEGDLPARFDAEGRLKLQVRPGSHTVVIQAVTDGLPDSLSPQPESPPKPAEEIWTWEADEKLRQVKVSGAPGIDPSRTDLPEAWRALPAFLLTAESALKLTTVRRGEPAPPPNRITLRRDVWMDLSGNGFTARDRFTGTLNRSWRLDLDETGTLGRVTVDGEDRLITAGQNGKPGVELRNGDLRMSAEWRTENAMKDLPAVGWTEDADSLHTAVHLPPGWTLLHATGADSVRGTWWDQWNLFGFFFVLVLSVATTKLVGLRWGIVALAGLVLAEHEPNAPVAAWAALLILVALLRVLKSGRLHTVAKIAFWCTTVWLLCVLVPFCVQQIRTGIYPQIALDNSMSQDAVFGLGKSADVNEFVVDDAPVLQEAPMAPPPMDAVNNQETSIYQKGRGGGGMLPSVQEIAKKRRAANDPKAVVQTGMGVPNWQWTTWHMVFSGPVKKDHRIALFLLSPKTNLLLAALRVLLLALFGFTLIRAGYAASKPKTGDHPKPDFALKKNLPATTTIALALAVFTGLPGVSAEQKSKFDEASEPDAPPSSLLDTLRRRLTEPPACAPDCSAVSLLNIVVEDERVTMTVAVHAAADTSIPLPGPAESWSPREILVDGRPSASAALSADGFIHLRVAAGIRTVVLRGEMPESGALVLALGAANKRVAVTADGWTVDGLHDNGRAEASLQFTRILRSDTENDAESQSVEDTVLPPRFEITRELDLGIPWTVLTTVRRVSPAGVPALLTVPLLPGESVTQSDLEVAKAGVTVSFSRDETEMSWSSTLKEQQEIVLEAQSDVPWSEIWTVACSPIHQCTFEGIAPISRKTDARLKPVYKPRPGERLLLKTARPEGIVGPSITVDEAELTMTPGIRLSRGELTLRIRTSRGGEQKVILPEGAEIQSVTMDGNAAPYQKSGSAVVTTLKTGAQSLSIAWQSAGGLQWRYRAPEVSLGGEAVNVKVRVKLPEDRWLIWANGPKWGPAILFWGFLIAVLLGGFVLGRLSLSPLKSYQWMLLLTGLTQVPVPVTLIVIAWFLLFERRRVSPFSSRGLFNTTQVLLAVYTLIAVFCLAAAVYTGLAVQPDMQVQGMESSRTSLSWYTDRINAALPTPGIVSFPVWVWKALMLAWALWAAASSVSWARWSWKAFASDGIWHKKQRNKTAPKTSDSGPPKNAEDPTGLDEPVS